MEFTDIHLIFRNSWEELSRTETEKLFRKSAIKLVQLELGENFIKNFWQPSYTKKFSFPCLSGWNENHRMQTKN